MIPGKAGLVPFGKEAQQESPRLACRLAGSARWAPGGAGASGERRRLAGGWSDRLLAQRPWTPGTWSAKTLLPWDPATPGGCTAAKTRIDSRSGHRGEGPPLAMLGNWKQLPVHLERMGLRFVACVCCGRCSATDRTALTHKQEDGKCRDHSPAAQLT